MDSQAAAMLPSERRFQGGQASYHTTGGPQIGQRDLSRETSCLTRRDPLSFYLLSGPFGVRAPAGSSAFLSQMSLERLGCSQMSVTVGITFQTFMFLVTSFILKELS